MAETASKVFISYSRKDKIFVKKLNDSLDVAGIDAWVDWEGIPLSSDWMAEITSAIEGAHAFLFVISPNSLASKVCHQELELGIKYNKKIVPILFRDLEKGKKLPEVLAKTNWVYLRTKKDKYDLTIPKLIDAINTDLDWVREHTRLLQRAREWDSKNRNNSFLLQGAELEEAERWMTQSTSKESRLVLPLQAEYISTSRKVSVQRQRNLMVGIFIALIISVLLGIFALFQRNIARSNEVLAKNNAATAEANEMARATQQAIAQRNEKAAEAQRSVADAQIYQIRAGQLDTSTLLAIDAWQRAEETGSSDIQVQAEYILRNNISFMPLPMAQMKQNDRVWNIKRNADGSRFVTSSSDKTACVWITATGQKDFCVKHDGIVYDALFSLDDKYLITGSDDATARVWDASSGTAIKEFKFDKAVWDLDVSPSGKWLAIGRADNYVTMIDLSNLDKRPINIQEKGEAYSVVFSPNSEWLAIGTNNGYTNFWNVKNSFYVQGPKHNDSVFAFAFSPDSKTVVSVGADSTARVSNVATGDQTHLLVHGDWVEDVAFGPDGTWFVTASDDNKVRIWDLKTGKEKLSMDQGDFVQRVYISPDGQWIASTGFDRTVRVWDTTSGSQMMEATLPDIGSGLRISKDGKLLIAADRKGNIFSWDISSLSARLGFLEFPQFVHEVLFDSSGKWLVANSDDYKVWKTATDQILSSRSGVEGESVISANDLTYDMAVSPDAKWIAVAEKNQFRALLYNSEDKSLKPLKHEDEVESVAFSSDSKFVATGGEDSKVSVWNLSTGERAFNVESDPPAYAMAYSPNGKWLVSGSHDQIVVWDTANYTQLMTGSQVGDINSVVFNRDGSLLATASSQGTVYVWNAKEADFNAPTYKLNVNGEALTADFSPDSKWLAIGSSAKFVHLWDLATGQEAARIPHVDKVTSVSFSGDGKLLAAVSRKVVEFWDVSAIPLVASEDIIETACRRLTSNMSETTWKLLFYEEEYKHICPDLPVGQN